MRRGRLWKRCTLLLMTARRSGAAARLAGTTLTLLPLVFARPAAGSDFVLIWDAPPECPSGELVRKEMIKRLGHKRRGLTLKASATVTRTDSAFRVQLQTYKNRQRGMRELEAPTCEALVQAISVIVALAVDPSLLRDDPSESDAKGADDSAEGESAWLVVREVSAHSERSERGEDETESRSTDREIAARPTTLDDAPPLKHSPRGGVENFDASDSEPLSEDTAAEPTRTFADLGLQGVASLAGSVESGVLPGLGFGLTARGGVRLRRFRVEAAISRWFSRETTSLQGQGADVDGIALATWACFRAVPAHTAAVPRLRSALPPDDAPAIEAGPCLGAEIGRLHARSFGVSDPNEGSAGYIGAGGALRLGATAADWLSLDVRFEAFRVLHRPKFEVENIGVVYEPSAWSVRAALGAEAYFP